MEKEMFVKETEEGIYKEGRPLFKYKESHHQKALNPKRIQYRIQTDEQDTCLNATMEAVTGSAGLHTTPYIDYRSPGKEKSSGRLYTSLCAPG